MIFFVACLAEWQQKNHFILEVPVDGNGISRLPPSESIEDHLAPFGYIA